MLTAVRKNIQLIFAYFRHNLAASMEYRSSFLVQTLGMALNNSAFIFFWWLLFQYMGEVGGYGFREVMMIWALSSTAYGITFICFGNVRRICKIIVSGELDTYLLQPKDPLISLIASGTVVSAWGDLFYGIILFFILSGGNLVKMALFLFLSIIGSTFYVSILVTAHSLTFFLGDAQGIADLITEFTITIGIYPEGIYQGIVRILIYTVLPTAFISFVPVRILQSFSWQWLGLLLLAMVVWGAISHWVFYRGLRHYESGNLIANKL